MNRSHKLAQHGFSLLEMMMVVLILSIITGVVFGYIVTVQKRYRTESARLDIQQESREFLDQMVRDIHTSGYPTYRIMGFLVPPAAPYNNPADPSWNQKVATGLIAVSYTDIIFEGDVDGSGTISTIRYKLDTNTPGFCPCFIGRSQQPKIFTGSPLTQDLGGAQSLPRYATEVQNVMNSFGSVNGLGGVIAVKAPYTISGNTPWGITNQAEYGLIATQPPLFEFYDSQGNLIPNIPADLSNPANVTLGITAARATAQVNIVINVLSPTVDMQTGLRPAASMRASVRVPNL